MSTDDLSSLFPLAQCAVVLLSEFAFVVAMKTPLFH